jgi:hypothetical protein
VSTGAAPPSAYRAARDDFLHVRPDCCRRIKSAVPL